MKKEEYIENEKIDLETLKEEFSKLKGKWFKGTAAKKEIEFLQFYIKQKQNLINQISDNLKNGK